MSRMHMWYLIGAGAVRGCSASSGVASSFTLMLAGSADTQKTNKRPAKDQQKTSNRPQHTTGAWTQAASCQTPPHAAASTTCGLPARLLQLCSTRKVCLRLRSSELCQSSPCMQAATPIQCLSGRMRAATCGHVSAHTNTTALDPCKASIISAHAFMSTSTSSTRERFSN
jgi:hypothetical protein